MSKDRMEAFSDGVIAILITIVVPDLKMRAVAGPAFEGRCYTPLEYHRW